MKKPVDEMTTLELFVETFQFIFIWWKNEWLRPSIYVLSGLCVLATIIHGKLPTFDGFTYVACLIVLAPFFCLAYNLIRMIAHAILFFPVWVFDKMFGNRKK